MLRHFGFRGVSSSDRRRRLISQLGGPVTDVVQVSEVVSIEESSERGSAAPLLDAIVSRSQRGESWSPVPVTLPALHRKFAETPVVTWLFTGDSTVSQLQNGSSVVSYTPVVCSKIRDQCQRGRDIFVNSESPGLQLAEVLDHFSERIGRFGAHIVVISCGLSEVVSQEGSSLAFERMFHRLIARVRESGGVPVVNMPHCTDVVRRGLDSDALIRLEAIRACTEESVAFLVDHWEEWGGGGSVELGDGLGASAALDAQALAEVFISALQLKSLVAAVP
ncbi:hypothetical protein [Planctomicrobium sp. SH527]|uniref:hypothetical protein n=1 Tax=Planctomicrobium sp. SH527 TaxID=3448123 RepID=UPI003F5C99AF